jgi:hypothetical protein
MKVFQWVMVVALAAFAAGCSTFNYEWRREARKPTATNDITGRWEGKWISEATGHNDPLQCLITHVSEGRYAARFRATYERVLHFSYTVILDAKPGTNGIDFHGTADLGKLAGGVYQYDGYATPTNFFSRYKSKHDRGTFQMGRPTR